MNNDLLLIDNLLKLVKNSACEFVKAYCLFSQNDIGENLQVILDAQLRMAEKLGQLQLILKENEDDYVNMVEIDEFLKFQKNLENNLQNKKGN